MGYAITVDEQRRRVTVMVAVTRGAKDLAHSLIAASRAASPGRIERRRVVGSLDEAHAWLDSQPPAPERQ